MKYSEDDIHNGPRRRQPLMAAPIRTEKQAAFTGNGRSKHHVHRWLMGTENAVCKSCGLTLPKAGQLPKTGAK